MNISEDFIHLTMAFSPRMKTSARIYVDRELQLPLLNCESPLSAIDQIAEVCSLPGLVGEVVGLPDIHAGYGFPIGCVAALDGYVSPGGVGYDINCGVRALRTNLGVNDIEDKDVLADALYSAIPTSGSKIMNLALNDLNGVLDGGMEWLTKSKLIPEEDRIYTESSGRMDACSYNVSQKAKGRGLNQLGSIGSGNHYVEVQVVSEIFDKEVADLMDLRAGQVVIMIHTGSRGLGHAVCHDSVIQMNKKQQAMKGKKMVGLLKKKQVNNTKSSSMNPNAETVNNIYSASPHSTILQSNNSTVTAYSLSSSSTLTSSTGSAKPEVENHSEGQLAYCSLSDKTGQTYLSAMGCAANYAFANRAIITQKIRETLTFLCPKSTVSVIYDVCHNIAKLETHNNTQVLVHRKGASRSFPPFHAEVPEKYRTVGQPVMVGGSMGTCSYILVGQEGAMEKTFGSTCHGAGRVLSRNESKKAFDKTTVCDLLTRADVSFRCSSDMGMVEEAPGCYKDVNRVVDHSEKIGIAKKVCKLKPYIVIKG